MSRALVSIVVRGASGASDQTRERVLAVADELGYRPDVRARMLARSTTHLIGVTYSVRSMHHADLLAPIYACAEASGYEVILSGKTPRHDERRALDALLGYRCDAVLMLGAEIADAEARALAGDVPIVLVGRRLLDRGVGIDTVRTDDAVGMRLAVAHLVGLGHSRIVHVDGGRGIKASDRRRGYRAAMAAAGLGEYGAVVAGGETGEAGRRAGAFLDAARPTAVIAYNDDCAWGVMRAIADRGLDVPIDVSVVGYDGSELSRLAPHELTTVRQDAEAMARIAVERALSRLDGATGRSREAVLEPTLVVGETTAAPPSLGPRAANSRPIRSTALTTQAGATR